VALDVVVDVSVEPPLGLDAAATFGVAPSVEVTVAVPPPAANSRTRASGAPRSRLRTLARWPPFSGSTISRTILLAAPATANPAGFASGLMIPPAAIIANPATTDQGATRTCTLRDSTAWPSQGRWSSKSI